VSSDENSEEAAAIEAIVAARATFKRLSAAAYDATEVLDRIEGARRQMSQTDSELRHQIENTKDRVNWLIGELDKLTAILGMLE
jgi:chromosome segregation ATPase